eukprot:scaffold121036_cov57-Phaeocystis_antarctica.AAC.2
MVSPISTDAAALLTQKPMQSLILCRSAVSPRSISSSSSRSGSVSSRCPAARFSPWGPTGSLASSTPCDLRCVSAPPRCLSPRRGERLRERLDE